MKALTVRQPWAWAIVAAGKDVENRSRRTHHRGWIVIHAGLARPPSHARLPQGVRKPKPEELVRGAASGVARLVDCVEKSRSKWFGGAPFGWVLKGARRLPKPIRCKGALGLWTVSPGVKAAITKQIGPLRD